MSLIPRYEVVAYPQYDRDGEQTGVTCKAEPHPSGPWIRWEDAERWAAKELAQLYEQFADYDEALWNDLKAREGKLHDEIARLRRGTATDAMTPYYPTIDGDLARAKEILAKGKASPWEEAQFTPEVIEALRKTSGGVIAGGDIYAAYKLLESFVAHIEYTHQQVTACHSMIEELQTFKDHAIALNKKAAKDAHYLRVEKRQQFQMLIAIREMADAATGINRREGDARDPGALGAVKALVAEIERLRAEVESALRRPD